MTADEMFESIGYKRINKETAPYPLYEDCYDEKIEVMDVQGGEISKWIVKEKVYSMPFTIAEVRAINKLLDEMGR